ncbi:uroporphyrinogen-III synthase [Microcella frigidaquae]|uniref:Uroporphyrinogen-III synthase n=1 Tax=Microcella frigidaquae TaxID=424758 RepID=A0A840XA49_9MICO|nr:uroporphyrinogen-III synthase [Microcella frigidaquae]NHN44342.1 uroporphyrinogen-III synthase [Microcella frigidaquae]
MVTPLLGWRVLVPRGGARGDGIAAQLRAQGAEPVIAPLITFAPSSEPERLARELEALQAGSYGWLVVTSATTVEVLARHGVRVPPTTRVAAVGDGTAQALHAAGYSVDFVPGDHSARGLVAEWPGTAEQGAVLIPQSAIAEPTLVRGLTARGLEVRSVPAYRTVGVTAGATVAADIAAGRIGAIVVSSGSIARQLAQQFAPLPDDTVIVCIGPRTAVDAREAGLPVHRIAEERSAAGLVRALVDHVTNRDDSRPAVTS